MFTGRGRRVAGVLALVTLLFAAGIVLPRVSAAYDPVPDSVLADLKALLQKKVADLVDQKNEEGLTYKRGSFSRNFKKVDDSTYQVTFHQDTASKDALKTERFLLTLQKGADGKWAVTKEELKDTYEGLYRTRRDQDEFYKFDKFTFNRYGMKVTATQGSVFKTQFMGKPNSFTLVADDLAYEYAPPKDLDYYSTYRLLILKEYPEDFVFKPRQIYVNGDGASMDEIIASSFTGLRKAALAEMSDRLKSVYNEAKTDWEDNLKKNGFSGFRLAWKPDRKTWDVLIKRDSAKDHSIWLDYDNYEGWDINFGTSDRGPVFGYYSEEVLKSAASPDELERRDDPDAKDFDLDSLSGVVEIGLEDEEALKGDLTYGMTIKRELRELPFYISRLRDPGSENKQSKNPTLLIAGITDGEGNDLTWVKTGPYSAQVVFPKPLPAGSKVTLRMQFMNRDSVYKINPSFSMMDRLGWIPFVRFTDPIEKFAMTVKVKDKYRVLGVGKKLSEKKENGVNITEWASDNAVSFPTVIFGDYIDDGPKIKATKSDGTEIPVRVYVDQVSTHNLDTKVLDAGGTMDDFKDLVQSYQGGSRGIRGKSLSVIADQAVNSLNLYREVWGQDYTYSKLDLVCDPMGDFYGQAPASIIFLGYGVFRGEGTVAAGSMFGGGGGTAKFLKDVVAHETGHQWWGALIGNTNNRNYWFIESATEYSAALFVEAVRGRKAYDEKVADWRRNILRFEELTSVQDASALWGGEFPGAAYVMNVYNKGPYGFHVLRSTFGDERFFKYLKMLAAEFKGKRIVGRDLQRVAEQAFGGDMEWFWDQWFRGVGLPQYALFYNVRATEDGKYLVEGKIRQRVVAGKGKTEMPGVYYRAVAPLTFINADGKEFKSKSFIVQGAETPFKFKIAEEPTKVVFNKDGEILAEDLLINEGW